MCGDTDNKTWKVGDRVVLPDNSIGYIWSINNENGYAVIISSTGDFKKYWIEQLSYLD